MSPRIRRLVPGAPALLLALVAAAGLSSCYELGEGAKYLSIRAKAESFDRALAGSAGNPALRSLLERAAAARRFAQEELGLRQTKSYSSVVILDADRLATVVQACAELSFTRYLWKYPVVGALPYRGYFDPKDADREARLLKKQGYDVIARPVDAFSTLGWLADPLFSFMSSYSEGDIADLVIHEMTHATIFLRGSRPGVEEFNEELATFVGREGSLLYLARVYGPGSRQVEEARESRADAGAFASYLEGTAKELEAVYSSSSTADDKRRLKAQTIAARAELFKKDYTSLFRTQAYRSFDMGGINNAYLDLYRIYEGESSLYADFYARLCGGDMRLFVRTIAEIARLPGDPKAEMRRRLDALGPKEPSP